ncbi:hypothetical protein [Ornithinibacillus sp. 179-J 7C1 HS]|uniref:hypothetical protein n=1 Tax=Ornithinibacillus sp. 179-J 7C1 HS TaxID=3142384 RepID=UPI0039A31EA0
MKNVLIVLSFLIVTSIGIYYVKDLKSAPTITYFPIDYGTSFDSASTSLELSSTEKQGYRLTWNVQSKSKTPLYLRQDVSLLFADGELYGMRSKWRENTDTITFTESIKANDNKKWEAISFHYGEIHHDDVINSIQKLSHEIFYVLKKDNHFIGLSREKSNPLINQKLDTKTKNNILPRWQKLWSHYNIDINQYYSIPLTSLYQFQEKPFPGFNQEDTDRIMGQLWEGIYKNYLIPFIDSKEKLTSYIPLILLDKNGEHLYVLYEMNSKMNRLIQKTR